METVELAVCAAGAGARLDAFVAAACGLSRTLAQQLVADKNVLLNGTAPPKGRKLAEGDHVRVCVPPVQPAELAAQDIPLDIVYEDGDLLVVNKPKGLVVHPAPGNPSGTLVNALMFHCAASLSGIGGELRPGIVHRIDKGTSGLLVVAKNDEAHRGLAKQFEEHSAERVYDAVVYGRFKQPGGEIDAPIGRSPSDRKKMAVTCKGSKRAITTWRVVACYAGFSHLKLELKTGRTHQIRVHMAQLGHPLAGDETYGPRKVLKQLQGQCLHAGVLGFTHPVSGLRLRFASPLPPYFTGFLAGLGPPEQTFGGERIKEQ